MIAARRRLAARARHGPAARRARRRRRARPAIVGGCVRDTLLGLDGQRRRPRHPARARGGDRAARARRGIKAVPTGIAHGTITAVIAGAPVEVTTLRRDVATDGRRATVAFTDDWREDAARRDFTINALSADPASGEIFDYFGGLADLDGAAGSASSATRCSASPRIICASCASSASTPASAAARPMPPRSRPAPRRANDLMALSRERIADELLKLLGAARSRRRPCALMIARGIFAPVLPEIVSADRLDALVAAERAAGIAPDPIRRLAALLPADPEVAATSRARLRLSKRAAQAPGRRRAHRGRDAPAAARLPDRRRRGGRPAAAVRRSPIEAMSRRSPTWQRPRLPIGGGDLIAMGLSAGPDRGGDAAGDRGGMDRRRLSGGSRRRCSAIARARVDQALRSQPVSERRVGGQRFANRRSPGRRCSPARSASAASSVDLDALGGRLHAERAGEAQDGADDRGRCRRRPACRRRSAGRS